MSGEILLFKILNNIIGTPMRTLINFAIPLRVTRSAPMFYIPHVNSNAMYFTPQNRMLRNHNELFNHITLIGNRITTFERK